MTYLSEPRNYHLHRVYEIDQMQMIISWFQKIGLLIENSKHGFLDCIDRDICTGGCAISFPKKLLAEKTAEKSILPEKIARTQKIARVLSKSAWQMGFYLVYEENIGWLFIFWNFMSSRDAHRTVFRRLQMHVTDSTGTYIHQHSLA